MMKDIIGVILAAVGMLVLLVVTSISVQWINQVVERIDGLENTAASASCEPNNAFKLRSAHYDPNDPAYKYLPTPPAKWLERFGDSERSRVLYGISAVRVQQEMQSQALAKIQRTLAGGEPNEVKR